MEKEKTIKNEKTANPYKLISLVLGLVLIIIGIVFMFNSAVDRKIDGIISDVNSSELKELREDLQLQAFQAGYVQGQQQTVLAILQELNNRGSVVVFYGTSNITLVSEGQLANAQKQVVDYIIDFVDREGSVKLINNATEIILVPYEEPEIMDLTN